MQKFILLALTTIILASSSCNSNIGSNLKIPFVLKQKFDFHYVEVRWNQDTVGFNLLDIDHSEMLIQDLLSYSLELDKFLSQKFHHLNEFHTKEYTFSGASGIEIVKFNIDSSGSVIKTKTF